MGFMNLKQNFLNWKHFRDNHNPVNPRIYENINNQVAEL